MTSNNVTPIAPTQEWTDLRTKIKAKWAKFVDTDIDAFKGNMHLIVDKVQKVYSCTKEKAEQEYSDFKKTLEPTVTPAEKAKPN
ncbi:MAG: hypothetical protein ABL958_00390 [Bdellovibrionia bacterium]